jgi:hypothetical protein
MQQVDLFPSTTSPSSSPLIGQHIQLDCISPCGRRRDASFCEVVEEHSSIASIKIFRCIWCGCIAPITTATS